MTTQNQFFVYLPSNTAGYNNNRPNKYRTHLPRTLDFKGDWVVGLHSISYVYSWDNLGALEKQWVKIQLFNNKYITLPIPSSSYSSPENFEKIINKNLLSELEKVLQKRDEHHLILENKTPKARKPRSSNFADTQFIMPEKAPEPKENPAVDENLEKLSTLVKVVKKYNPTSIIPFETPTIIEVPQKSVENIKEPLKAVDPIYFAIAQTLEPEESIIYTNYQNENVFIPGNLSNDKVRNIVNSIKFVYNSEINKFTLKFNDSYIDYLSFSPQLAYLMGFLNENHVENNEIGKYSMDLKGGIHSFGVYAKDITENIICGSELVSLLRIVSITGTNKFGDTVENIYNTPIYLRVLPKQLSEIEIELRTVNGDARLIPFHYGTTTVVLVFKKVINF
jgi:hypothetical protein